MSIAPLDVLNNATAISLRWGTSGIFKTLSTGEASFRAHFAPVSSRATPRAQSFGAQIGNQLTVDYALDLDVGDIVVIQTLRGETVSQWHEVKGVDLYPSSFLPHKVVFITRYKQG